VTVLGKIYARQGVRSNCPEGNGWLHITTPERYVILFLGRMTLTDILKEFRFKQPWINIFGRMARISLRGLKFRILCSFVKVFGVLHCIFVWNENR